MPPFAVDFFTVLTAIFVVVDPLPVAPTFAALTADRSVDDVRRIARRASLAGALLLTFFALFGATIFEVLHINLAAFRAAGGLLLLLTALDMLRAKASPCVCAPRELDAAAGKDDISLVPLATPLLAGPGAIATVMVLASERSGAASTAAILLAIGVTFAATYLVLRAGRALQRALGVSGLAMMQRVMGLLLAAIAIQFMVEGTRRLLGL